MPILFDPARHEALAGAPWDESAARGAIHAIVADTEAAMSPDITWPWHPLDAEGSRETEHKSLYLGAAGNLWALWTLRESGFAQPRVPPESRVAGLHDAYRARPDTGTVVPSYLLGEAGILLLQFRFTGSALAADRLATAIGANHRNPSLEFLWGGPGTMVAASHMHVETGEERWKALWLESAQVLWDAWQPSGHAPCRLWMHDLYGRPKEVLGSGHGFAGNLHALLRGLSWWDEARRQEALARCDETLRVTAMREEGVVNWPHGPDVKGREKLLVQWCHGAPGMITGLDAIPPGTSRALDALLVAGGELTWRAGPLAKGPGLCHGTAGNGYAFLKLHRRTGDARWLERARAFAMHAIAQSRAARETHGRGRHSLWTGDPGVAIYLRDCITGSADWPTLDVF